MTLWVKSIQIDYTDCKNKYAFSMTISIPGLLLQLLEYAI